MSPARDALLKKGLIYSSQRGRIAFTVPHFGRYLREQIEACRHVRRAGGSRRASRCPAATPALIERVEPYWAIEQTVEAARAASSVRPVPS